MKISLMNVTPEVLATWTQPVSTLSREELESRYLELKMTLESRSQSEETGRVEFRQDPVDPSTFRRYIDGVRR